MGEITGERCVMLPIMWRAVMAQVSGRGIVYLFNEGRREREGEGRRWMRGRVVK